MTADPDTIIETAAAVGALRGAAGGLRKLAETRLTELAERPGLVRAALLLDVMADQFEAKLGLLS